jgi:hypothetical protein
MHTRKDLLPVLNGNYTNKLYEQESQNSSTESESPSTPSTELVVAGHELEHLFVHEAHQKIEAARVERLVNEHYFARAKKVYKKLWRVCGKKTKHSYEYAHAGGYSADWRICSFCGKPEGSRKEEREKRGIQFFAAKLREADKAAGVEFIP